MSTAAIATYAVTVSTPGGPAELDIPTTLGAGAAMRRAKWAAVQIGWGDVDEVTATAARLIHCLRCRDTGRVAAPGTAGLHGNHPDADDVTCPDCGGS